MAFFETMKYKSIKKDGRVEIRKYDDIFLASTKTSLNETRNSGFSNVFNYISGQNDKKEKISMTTPVVTYEENDLLVTGFYVPSKYTKDKIPKPSKNQVFINNLEKSYYAVIRFRGKWTDKNFDKHDKVLLEYIDKHNLEIRSQRLIMRYQPPFIPTIFRRNEIAYQINYSQE